MRLEALKEWSSLMISPPMPASHVAMYLQASRQQVLIVVECDAHHTSTKQTWDNKQTGANQAGQTVPSCPLLWYVVLTV